ncbi:MAG: hypothetical protein JO135_08420 [Candidatus Eremiobacteraeota bacterium]|nr:hypothetical protein [Candidatus Eremiobacteraeota bacterium]
MPNAPRIAQPQAIPLVAGRPPVPTRRELAKIVPKAPPNPTPAPPAPLQRNLQRAQVAVGTPTPAAIPAVPVVAPTPLPIIAPKPQFTAQPTAAPSVAPTARATLVPRATASPVPSKSPVAAATAVPTRAPTPSAIAATPAVAASAPARVAASPSAQRTPGVPRPAPSGIASPSAQRGNAPSPGPKAAASAGPGAVPRASAKPQPPRPLSLPPTPSPAPKRTAKPANVSPQKAKAYADLNARLRKLLPNNPVKPTTKRYSTGPEAMRPSEPTPPPDVVAKTKYIYRSAPPNGGFLAQVGLGQRSFDRFVMWVTAMKKIGPITMCYGWLVRYPSAPPSYGRVVAGASGPLHGGAVILPNPGPRPENGFMPIIEADAAYVCPAGSLEPFSPQPPPQK